MAEIIDSAEIYRRIDACMKIFADCEGSDEAAQAVLDLIKRDFDLIQAAMLIMLQKSPDGSGSKPHSPLP